MDGSLSRNVVVLVDVISSCYGIGSIFLVLLDGEENCMCLCVFYSV